MYKLFDPFLDSRTFFKIAKQSSFILFLLFFHLLSFISFLLEREENIWDDGAFLLKSVFLPCLTVLKLCSDSCLFLYLLLMFSLCYGTKCVVACTCVEWIWTELWATPAVFLYLPPKPCSCLCSVSCLCSRIIYPATHLGSFQWCYHACFLSCT